MTETEKEKAWARWLPIAATFVVLAGGVGASWYNNSERISLLEQRVETQQLELAALKAADDQTARALRNVEKVLVKVDTTLDFLRGRLGLGAMSGGR